MPNQKKGNEKLIKIPSEVVRRFFLPPLFDFYYKWKPISHRLVNTYENSGDVFPVYRATEIAWTYFKKEWSKGKEL